MEPCGHAYIGEHVLAALDDAMIDANARIIDR